MAKIKELLQMVEDEFSPTERESAKKIANQLLENPALYLKKFTKYGTKNETKTSDPSMAPGQHSEINNE